MFPQVFSILLCQQNTKNTFFHLHNISHPGRLTSQRLVSSRFMWRGLARDLTAWAKNCLHCQQRKTHRHINTSPLHIPVPKWCFSHLHIELVGPFHLSNNSNDIFTIIDRTSKWMEAIPLASPPWQTMQAPLSFIGSLLIVRCLTSRIARPQLTILRQMVWSKGCTAASRRLYVHMPAVASWAEEISWILLSLCSQPRKDSGISLAEADYGAPLVLPS
jgi:hypothetical protein